MICEQCGAKLPQGVVYCTSCGARTGADPGRGTHGTDPDGAGAAGAGESLVGWSAHANNPEILAAAASNRKWSARFSWFVLLAFPVGFFIAGLVMDELPLNEALLIGAGLGVLVFAINMLRLRGAKAPTWEGAVVDKSQRERTERRDKDDNSISYYTEFTVTIRTDAGKKVRIVETDSRRMYDYLAVGDRVRYHPAFGTYEKYDKTRDRIIYCNVCSTMNPIANDRCKRCNLPLFK